MTGIRYRMRVALHSITSDIEYSESRSVQTRSCHKEGRCVPIKSGLLPGSQKRHLLWNSNCNNSLYAKQESIPLSADQLRYSLWETGYYTTGAIVKQKFLFVKFLVIKDIGLVWDWCHWIQSPCNDIELQNPPNYGSIVSCTSTRTRGRKWCPAEFSRRSILVLRFVPLFWLRCRR